MCVCVCVHHNSNTSVDCCLSVCLTFHDDGDGVRSEAFSSRTQRPVLSCNTTPQGNHDQKTPKKNTTMNQQQSHRTDGCFFYIDNNESLMLRCQTFQVPERRRLIYRCSLFCSFSSDTGAHRGTGPDSAAAFPWAESFSVMFLTI